MLKISGNGKLLSLHALWPMALPRGGKVTLHICWFIFDVLRQEYLFLTFSEGGVLELEEAYPCFVNLKTFLWSVQTHKALSQRDLSLLD